MDEKLTMFELISKRLNDYLFSKHLNTIWHDEELRLANGLRDDIEQAGYKSPEEVDKLLAAKSIIFAQASDRAISEVLKKHGVK